MSEEKTSSSNEELQGAESVAELVIERQEPLYNDTVIEGEKTEVEKYIEDNKESKILSVLKFKNELDKYVFENLPLTNKQKEQILHQMYVDKDEALELSHNSTC